MSNRHRMCQIAVARWEKAADHSIPARENLATTSHLHARCWWWEREERCRDGECEGEGLWDAAPRREA